MNGDQHNYLRAYANNLVTALFYSYSSNLPHKALTDIERIYKEISGSTQSFNLSCSTCAINLLSLTARYYFTEYPEELDPLLSDRFLQYKIKKN